MWGTTRVCGFIICHPRARFFGAGRGVACCTQWLDARYETAAAPSPGRRPRHAPNEASAGWAYATMGHKWRQSSRWRGGPCRLDNDEHQATDISRLTSFFAHQRTPPAPLAQTCNPVSSAIANPITSRSVVRHSISHSSFHRAQLPDISANSLQTATQQHRHTQPHHHRAHTAAGEASAAPKSRESIIASVRTHDAGGSCR